MSIKIPPKSYSRGHEIIFNEDINKYFYADNGEEFHDQRPCAKCRKMPTKEGHDACLGTLPNVKYACCGHGVWEGYVVLFSDGGNITLKEYFSKYEMYNNRK